MIRCRKSMSACFKIRKVTQLKTYNKTNSTTKLPQIAQLFECCIKNCAYRRLQQNKTTSEQNTAKT